MAKSKLWKKKKKKTKKRVYLRCSLCGECKRLPDKEYCHSCQEQERLIEVYWKMLEERGLI